MVHGRITGDPFVVTSYLGNCYYMLLKSAFTSHNYHFQENYIFVKRTKFIVASNFFSKLLKIATQHITFVNNSNYFVRV